LLALCSLPTSFSEIDGHDERAQWLALRDRARSLVLQRRKAEFGTDLHSISIFRCWLMVRGSMSWSDRLNAVAAAKLERSLPPDVFAASGEGALAAIGGGWRVRFAASGCDFCVLMWRFGVCSGR
jgi:hypothetical protein